MHACMHACMQTDRQTCMHAYVHTRTPTYIPQVYKKLNLLESIYIDLLGPDFRYRVGVQGPHTDLFYWNVLLNRAEMAKLMWNSVSFPVRCLGCRGRG